MFCSLFELNSPAEHSQLIVESTSVGVDLKKIEEKREQSLRQIEIERKHKVNELHVTSKKEGQKHSKAPNRESVNNKNNWNKFIEEF